MNMIPRRSKVSRTTFRKLPNGGVYYIASSGAGPFVKIGGHAKLMTNSDPQTTPTQATPPDTTIEVINVDRYFQRQQS